mmetsp:Transcript_17428/g.55170  ORF Transcript_17428/g.55170 Transcript_17428/m.55170 type:complete len:205 (+) Transcript_17428:1054-1668(+)
MVVPQAVKGCIAHERADNPLDVLLPLHQLLVIVEEEYKEVVRSVKDVFSNRLDVYVDRRDITKHRAVQHPVGEAANGRDGWCSRESQAPAHVPRRIRWLPAVLLGGRASGLPVCMVWHRSDLRSLRRHGASAAQQPVEGVSSVTDQACGRLALAVPAGRSPRTRSTAAAGAAAATAAGRSRVGAPSGNPLAPPGCRPRPQAHRP